MGVTMSRWLNAWIELDLSEFTGTQIRTFFDIVIGSPQYDALSNFKKAILRTVHQANPELNAAGGIRMYRSTLNARKWLMYLYFPEEAIQIYRNMPEQFSDNVRKVALNLVDIPEAIQTEYFGEVVDLEDDTKNYPFFNVFAGVRP